MSSSSIPVPKAEPGEGVGPAIPPTYVPARNTVLLALELAWAETLGARDLFLGANVVDYSGYPDCRPDFLWAFEALARVGTKAGVEGASFRIHAPMLRMTYPWRAMFAFRSIDPGSGLGDGQPVRLP